MKLVQESQESLKQLAEHVSKELQPPKSPEKVEVESNSRRSYKTRRIVPAIAKPANETKPTEEGILNTLVDNPIVNMGRKMPQYGLLAKILFMNSIESASEPTPVVETRGGAGNATVVRKMLVH